MYNDTPEEELPKLVTNTQKTDTKPPKQIEMSKILYDDCDHWAKVIIDMKHYPALKDKVASDFTVEFSSYNTFSVVVSDLENNSIYKYACMKTWNDYDVAGSKWSLKPSGKLYICLKKTDENEWENIHMS